MKEAIGFIGTGNMATAIVQGLAKEYAGMEHYISVSNRPRNNGTISKAEGLHKIFNVNLETRNVDIVKKSKIIFLTIKPNVYPRVLEEIKDTITSDHIIVSVAAGVTIALIEDFFDKPVKVIRTMPNTPVFVGEGMTAITPNKHVTDNELKTVAEIFNSMGEVEIIGEEIMDAIPAISGSSPAYVYTFIEALADGGVSLGIPRDKAYKFAAQAVYGAAKMVLESNEHPAVLKDKVCSPSGSTIEALYVLEKNKFRGTIIEAMKACTHRSKELGLSDQDTQVRKSGA